MMEFLSVPPGGLLSEIKTDEVLVVLGSPSSPDSPTRQKLKHRIHPAFTNRSNDAPGIRLEFGVIAEGPAFILVSWEPHRESVSGLERRWLLNRLQARLRGQFNCRKIAFLVEKQSAAAELVAIEDTFTKHLDPLQTQPRFQSIRVFCEDSRFLARTDRHHGIRWQALQRYRQWVNANPDDMTSLAIGSYIAEAARDRRLESISMDNEALKKAGLRLLLAVGKAADSSPPRLHICRYAPTGSQRKPLLLVGKGVTFDTGGINLKPHASYVNCMKNDMAGAALMTHLFFALIDAEYPHPLTLAVPACENVIGTTAMKPGTIVKSHAGKDVYIEHTDAEGRLILADAISFTERLVNPGQTFVAATLTTAALRQFTNFFSAVHFADHETEKALTEAARDWCEAFTFWPHFLPFAHANKTVAGDLTNMGRMPAHVGIGGACNVAAHFLKQFSNTPLVHIDIFASAWNWSGDYPGASYGATGAPFNSLFHGLLGMA